MYKPVENIPNVTTNENTNVHKSDSDGSNESDEDPQSTMRRSKRLTKPIDRLQVNQIFAEKEILDVEYSRKRDFAQMLFNKVFPT